MMNDEAAAQLARLRSRMVPRRSDHELEPSRSTFDDRGGVPGKHLRAISQGLDAPPVPRLPSHPSYAESTPEEWDIDTFDTSRSSVKEKQPSWQTRAPDNRYRPLATAKDLPRSPPPPPHSPRPNMTSWDGIQLDPGASPAPVWKPRRMAVDEALRSANDWRYTESHTQAPYSRMFPGEALYRDIPFQQPSHEVEQRGDCNHPNLHHARTSEEHERGPWNIQYAAHQSGIYPQVIPNQETHRRRLPEPIRGSFRSDPIVYPHSRVSQGDSFHSAVIGRHNSPPQFGRYSGGLLGLTLGMFPSLLVCSVYDGISITGMRGIIGRFGFDWSSHASFLFIA